MKETDNDHLQITNRQKFLGTKGFIIFIALMNMFVPLSTDLYLPALPKMSSYFDSYATIVNLTLSVFFIFYSIGILIWGPLSDKYGRKPVILIGSSIYILSSIACALSTNVYFLILARAVQGIGSGGITSASMAIIKDSFAGKRREKILAITQSISGLAPMLAPVIGAFILKFFDWRGTFWTLTLICVLNLILALLYQESLKENERYKGSLLGSMSRLIVVGKNKSFIIPALIFSLPGLPFLGYIAISSYIYVDYFGLSEQVYSYFFAANALIAILGPTIYVRYLSGLNNKLFVAGCFGVTALSGILMMTIGTFAPVAFLICNIMMSLMMTAMRPFSTNLLFDQQKGDAGSASSIMNTSFTVFGSIGMTIASISWGNMVIGLGAIITIVSLICMISWHLFLKSDIPCIGIKEVEQKTATE